MIYDCFSFFNELDILEIRLNTLNDVVDKFILVEATKTHTGHAKPLYFSENRNRFTPFLDKIIHIVVDDYPEPPADYSVEERAWVIENHQRNAIVRGLTDAKPEDILTITDADEIPSPEVIQWYHGRHGMRTLKQRLYYYYLNLRNYTHPYWGDCIYGPKILTFRDFLDPRTYRRTRPRPRCAFINQGPTATNVRTAYAPRADVPGGWHFSYLGNIAHIQKKLRSYAEVSFATNENLSAENIQRRLTKGEDILGNGERLFFEKVDIRFPKFIMENQRKLSSLIGTDGLQSRPSHMRIPAYIHGRWLDAFENNIKCPLRPLYDPIRRWLGS